MSKVYRLRRKLDENGRIPELAFERRKEAELLRPALADGKILAFVFHDHGEKIAIPARYWRTSDGFSTLLNARSAARWIEEGTYHPFSVAGPALVDKNDFSIWLEAHSADFPLVAPPTQDPERRPRILKALPLKSVGDRGGFYTLAELMATESKAMQAAPIVIPDDEVHPKQTAPDAAALADASSNASTTALAPRETSRARGCPPVKRGKVVEAMLGDFADDPARLHALRQKVLLAKYAHLAGRNTVLLARDQALDVLRQGLPKPEIGAK